MNFKRHYFHCAVARIVWDSKSLIKNPYALKHPNLFVLLILKKLPAEKSDFKIQKSSYTQSEIPYFVFIWAPALSAQLHLPREPRATQIPSQL